MAQPTPALRSTATQVQSRARARRSYSSRFPAPSGQASGKLQRWQALADASPRVTQLQRLRFLAMGDDPQQVPSSTASNRLPEGLQRGIEALSGVALDHVHVHYNSAMPAQFQALAYAQGNDIHLAPGQEHHLPHEAWHLVQQAQGRVQPTVQLNGNVAVNDDPALEREADVMGARALRIGEH